MLKEVKEKFPNWCEDTDTKLQLMMSDDIDALMCYMFQKIQFNRECEYFIDMSSKKAYENYSRTIRHDGTQTLYKTKDATKRGKNLLTLDVSINRNNKSWDNHVVQLSENETNYNKLSANMNVAMNVNKSNYTSKFCISTFITMLSYYNYNISKFDRDKLALICAIDSTYYPFNTSFEYTATKNLKLLGFGSVVDFIKKNRDYIQQIDKKYLKDKHIYVKNGYLDTNLNLNVISDLFNCTVELPTKKFTKCAEFKSQVFDANKFRNKEEMQETFKKKIFNIALTYKQTGIVSFIEPTNNK
ncbi:hypothetical protein [Clostridium sp. BJN0001]|uniref:hypothetical protein n=1 Tax=Clostridium sp. BJN0001 TaxID=2930219 RepID=UPI001FD49218|nr:hypothetical protein [Clostridium sp. BJN0001]